MDHAPIGKFGETEQWRESARRQVASPAIGLMVLAACGALIGIVQAIGVLGTFAVMAGDKGLPREHEALAVYSVFGGGSCAGVMATFAYSIIFFGALSMKRLRQRKFAIAAAVLALVPCASPCFLLSVPLGIWALMTLNSTEVKNAFE